MTDDFFKYWVVGGVIGYVAGIILAKLVMRRNKKRRIQERAKDWEYFKQAILYPDGI